MKSRRCICVQEFLKIIWDHAHDGIFIFEVQPPQTMRLVQANPFAQYFLKKPMCASLGDPIEAVFPQDFAQDIYKACSRCLENNVNTHYSLTLHKPGEETTYWDVFLKKQIRNHHQQILFWCRDVTPRVHLAQFRKSICLEYDGLFTSSTIGVGLLILQETGEPVLERSNKCFDSYVSMLLRSCPDLKEKFIQQVQLGENTAGQLYALKSGQKELFTYDISFIKSSSGRVSKAFVLLIHSLGLAKLAKNMDHPLTQRECEMLQLVCQGVTNKSIAKTLKIAEGTVKKTLYNAYRKLDVQSRAEAVHLLLSNPNMIGLDNM